MSVYVITQQIHFEMKSENQNWNSISTDWKESDQITESCNNFSRDYRIFSMNRKYEDFMDPQVL